MLEYEKYGRWYRFIKTGSDRFLSNEEIMAIYPAFDWRVR
jgi:hypothetical protein